MRSFINTDSPLHGAVRGLIDAIEFRGNTVVIYSSEGGGIHGQRFRTVVELGKIESVTRRAEVWQPVPKLNKYEP